MSALDRLTGDAQTFREKVWASRVHHHRVDPAELAAYLSLEDADRLLTATAIRTPSVRLVRDGSMLPEKGYTRHATITGRQLTGLVDARTAVDEFRRGATVVFQGLHRSFPPLVELIGELELELGHPCQANAYLTPPGTQGFAVHADTHDVFVLQTAGTKQWELHPIDGDAEAPLLEPGHVMYLPTGTPHAARAQDTVSLHITIGINQLTWRGLVERALASLASEVPADHLPAGYLDDPHVLAHQLGRHLSDVADRLRGIDPDVEVQREVRRFLTSRPPRLEGALVDVLALDAIDDDTVLRRRPGHACVLVDREDRLEVLLGDRTLDVPARLRPALELVRGSDELRP
ncbi:MAG TPA: cupin domain-containing protein, partial [Nocardioides sp.]|nr:cupin domain-containing protein [Nocardioides sp.]